MSLSKFLQTNNLLINNQNGFCTGLNTEKVLLTLISHTNKGREHNNNVSVVFLDIQKAFDMVCHANL